MGQELETVMHVGRATGVVVMVVVALSGTPRLAAQAWDSYPAEARRHYERGQKLFREERYEEAKDAYVEAIEAGLAKFSGVNVALARCYLNLGDHDRAIRLFSKFFRDFPLIDSCRNCTFRAHLGRGMAHSMRGEYSKALEDQTGAVNIVATQVNLLIKANKPVPRELLSDALDAYEARARTYRKLAETDAAHEADAESDDQQARRVKVAMTNLVVKPVVNNVLKPLGNGVQPPPEAGKIRIRNTSDDRVTIALFGKRYQMEAGEVIELPGMPVGTFYYQVNRRQWPPERRESWVNRNETLTLTIG